MQSETQATETIQGAVRQTAPWIERVDVGLEPDGFLVRLYPDRLMVMARAIQQGLRDESVKAAVRNPRFQRALVAAVERANRPLDPEHRIQRHEVVDE
jgi:nitrate reductase beta subunit